MANPNPPTPKSRAQAQRPTEESVRDSIPVIFEEQGNLPNVPARDGYVHRWIRVEIRGDADRKNVYNAMRKGWSPRPADSVPVTLRWLTSQREGMGNVVGTHDTVLMERPIDINDQEAALKKSQRREQIKAVKQNLFNEHANLGGSGTGLSAPIMESSARVETGQPVKIQND